MSRNSWFFLSFLLLRAFVLNAASGEAPPEERFSVKPYFYTFSSEREPLFSGRLAVSWAYGDAPVAKHPTVEIRQDGKKVATITPTSLPGRFYRAVIPDLSGYTGELTYELSDLEGARPIPGHQKFATDSVSFWYVSDHHIGKNNKTAMKNMLARMARLPADFILNGGDIFDSRVHHVEKKWPDFLNFMEPVWGDSVFMATPGNNDYAVKDNKNEWARYLGTSLRENYYTYDRGPVRFIVLNSNFSAETTLLESQEMWISDLLEQKQIQPWTVVLSHHPPVSAAYWDQTMKVKQESKPDSQLLNTQIFSQFKARGTNLLWVAGDIHYYQALQEGCAAILTAGATGGKNKIEERIIKSVNPAEIVGYPDATMTRFEATREGLTGSTYTHMGKIIHRFSIPFLSPSGLP